MPKNSPRQRKPSIRRSPEQVASDAQLVLAHMRTGLSMRKSCEKIDISPATFCAWLEDNPELVEQYRRAREAMMEVVADELLEIADQPVGMTDNGSTDSGAVAKQRLQVDTRKWLLSKLAAKKYGDKMTVDSNATVTAVVTHIDDEQAKRIAAEVLKGGVAG